MPIFQNSTSWPRPACDGLFPGRSGLDYLKWHFGAQPAATSFDAGPLHRSDDRRVGPGRAGGYGPGRIHWLQKCAATQAFNTIEQLTDDPLNGRFAGYQRDCRPAFNPDLTYLLQPLPGARPLSEVVDFTKTNLGDLLGCGTKTAWGEGVAVLGYFAWSMIQSLAKSYQIKALFRWLSRDRFPAYIASYSSAALWLRPDAQGQLAIMLLNTSLDPAALDGAARLDWRVLPDGGPHGRARRSPAPGG